MHLTIRDLSKTYPNGTQALKGVSLDIPPGMFGLLGRNGAGKSTLMRILATLQEPDEGSVSLGDPSTGSGQAPSTGSGQAPSTSPRQALSAGPGQRIDVIRQKDRVRETLGYLPQSFGFHPRVSAERLLDHFAVLKGVIEPGPRLDVVESLLRRTNLWEVRKQRVGTFSGGMRQRFGVAVALLGNPKLIIVDEPTAGLDPAERVRFLNLLSEIGEDAVVILSTHIVEDVSELCSRMAIIDKGRILVEGEPLAAIDALRGKIWKRVIDRTELEGVEREHRVISTRLLAGRTLVHAASDTSPGADWQEVDPSLEDVYFNTMAAA